jgi:hypothetical protein
MISNCRCNGIHVLPPRDPSGSSGILQGFRHKPATVCLKLVLVPLSQMDRPHVRMNVCMPADQNKKRILEITARLDSATNLNDTHHKFGRVCREIKGKFLWGFKIVFKTLQSHKTLLFLTIALRTSNPTTRSTCLTQKFGSVYPN